MQISMSEFKSGRVTLPLVRISVHDDNPSAIVIHGYGGNKEEQLGLSFQVSRLGFNTYTIDLRGHGQNAEPLGMEILEDVNALVRSMKGKAKTVTIGHSLGGRVSLLSEADIRVGISPALSRTFSKETLSTINTLRKYRVVEKDSNSHILKTLPVVDDTMTGADLILYGERDVPEIARACQLLAKKGKRVVQIPNALHSDIFLLESTFDELRKVLASVLMLPT